MAFPQPIEYLPPQWQITPNGDCCLIWGQARFTLNYQGTITLENPQANLTLNSDGNIQLEAKNHIHLNSREH